MTENQFAVNAIHAGWKCKKMVCFFMRGPDGEEHQVKVPWDECRPAQVRLLERKKWVVLDSVLYAEQEGTHNVKHTEIPNGD